MKLMTMKQYMNMSKPALIRKITKTLRVMPQKRLAVLCYNITKSKLPRMRGFDPRYQTRRPYIKSTIDWSKPELDVKREVAWKTEPRRKKTKRKFSRKQLAAQRLFAKRARAGTLKRRRR